MRSDQSNNGHRPLRLVVVTAGTSVPSSTRMLADRIVGATGDSLAARGHELDVANVEVREIAHDVVDATLTRFPSDRLKSVLDELSRADGVIAVSPIYNQAPSGLFTSFVGVLEPDSLAGVPVALGATGGTARHSLAIDYGLRPVFSYLKADVVPTTVFAASEDFGATTTSADSDSLGGRTVRAGTELADFMLRFAGITGGAVAPTRAADAEMAADGTAPAPRGRRSAADEFEDFVPMGDLLGGR